MPTIRQIVIAHDRYVTSAVAAYEARLDDLVRAATARTVAELTRRLAVDKTGAILGTAANRRVLRSVDALFTDALDAAGFDSLNRAYAGQFAGQLPYLDEILDAISAGLKTPLKDVRAALDAQDAKDLANAQASTVDSLSAVADAVAANAKRQALFGFAGLSLPDLAATLARTLGKTTGNAETIADTAMTGFYRTATDRAFKVIEKDLPEMKIRYEYEGPDDLIIRPWCKRMVESGKTYSRAEIDLMNAGAGQPGPVWIFCGGFACRHSWIISLN